MPDFTYENYYACQDLDERVSKIRGSTGIHTVRYNRIDGWSCTCDGFKFHKKCKHIAAEQKKKCNWCQEWDGGSPIEKNGEKLCPKCDGPVFVYRSAV